MKGEREAWAKGIALGLYHIAKRQKRCFSAILFSYSEEDMQRFDILGDDVNDEEQLKNLKVFTESFIGGNTDFEPPLKESVKIIEKDDEYEKADIVFITDGQAKISDSLKDKLEELKNKMEFKIVGVGVGYSAGGLDEFADVVYPLKDIIRDGTETAEDTFQLI